MTWMEAIILFVSGAATAMSVLVIIIHVVKRKNKK